MPANLTAARTKLAALKARVDSSTGYVDDLEALLDDIAGAMNLFGTAATEDVGVAEGDIPVLGAGGRLDAGRLPETARIDTWTTRPTSREVGDAIANARLAAWAPVWSMVPSAVLYGDATAVAGGTLLEDGWSTLNLVRQDAATNPELTSFNRVEHFREFELRTIKPGSLAVQTVIIPNPYRDGVARKIFTGELPEFRQQPADAERTRIQVRSGGAAGYRILSVQGVNDPSRQGLAAAAVVEALAARVAPPVLVAVDNATNSLFSVDPWSGATERIGLAGTLGAGTWSCGARLAGRLFLIDNATNSLWWVDLATGTPSRVGIAGALGANRDWRALIAVGGNLVGYDGTTGQHYYVNTVDGTAAVPGAATTATPAAGRDLRGGASTGGFGIFMDASQNQLRGRDFFRLIRGDSFSVPGSARSAVFASRTWRGLAVVGESVAFGATNPYLAPLFSVDNSMNDLYRLTLDNQSNSEAVVTPTRVASLGAGDWTVLVGD